MGIWDDLADWFNGFFSSSKSHVEENITSLLERELELKRQLPPIRLEIHALRVRITGAKMARQGAQNLQSLLRDKELEETRILHEIEEIKYNKQRLKKVA